ncbi:transposase [Candidatus Paracaedibacter symbiosus]|uniref:transposase n=1 Tax=Candidatus Paracaedibacter symbiosus TaxID=244582 RepID=UPI0009FC788F
MCNEHGISQSQYYQWKDQFLANASKAFEVEKASQKQARLECENQKLKGLVDELTLELKKSEEWS